MSGDQGLLGTRSTEKDAVLIDNYPELIDNHRELANFLGDETNDGQLVRTRLKASERVIARVTDGIYREPASALRELISNAWDADANNVTILTDAPRFARIHVRDDGEGMSHETLARLLHHIGGSAKRRDEGRELGITSPEDTDRTVGGRLIIGKIGIGLFSVSQLARRFRIITKTRGANYRLVAEVRLRTYAEDGPDDESREDSDDFVTGEVYLVREPTSDLDAHGTDVILEDVKPRVRDLLRSADRWRAVKEKDAALAAGDLEAVLQMRVEKPRYHAGWIEDAGLDPSKPAVLSVPPQLPWDVEAPPTVRMSLLVDAVEAETSRTERPDLSTTLDTYLETLWVLGLSIPVEYVDKHPFELTANDEVRLFWISNSARGQAEELTLSSGQTVRQAVERQVNGSPKLQDGLDSPAGGFRVVIDGVEIKRPIRFRFVRTERRGLDKSMLFVGRYDPNLARVDARVRGGDLALEGYLFWNGRVIPKENNGVLIRIRGTSGALFDRTFFNYQISEQTRLRQITSELYIRRGLDAALNIDRESFNFSHPHVQLVGTWVHRAIRQLTNKHKDISKRLREQRVQEDAAASKDVLVRHAEDVWRSRHGDEEPIPEVAIVSDSSQANRLRSEGYVTLSRAEMPSLGVTVKEAERKNREAKAEALVRILAAYGVLVDRSYAEQQELVEAILTAFFGPPQR